MNALPKLTERDEARFWSKVALPNREGCMLWLAGTEGGYGRFWLAGSSRSAHRLSYERAYGPIPDGLVLDHLCRTPICVAPLHLEAVTVRENTLRGETRAAANAAKTHCPQGHKYAGDNLHVKRDGKRHCRACDAAAHRRRKAASC